MRVTARPLGGEVCTGEARARGHLTPRREARARPCWGHLQLLVTNQSLLGEGDPRTDHPPGPAAASIAMRTPYVRAAAPTTTRAKVPKWLGTRVSTATTSARANAIRLRP